MARRRKKKRSGTRTRTVYKTVYRRAKSIFNDKAFIGALAVPTIQALLDRFVGLRLGVGETLLAVGGISYFSGFSRTLGKILAGLGLGYFVYEYIAPMIGVSRKPEASQLVVWGS